MLPHCDMKGPKSQFGIFGLQGGKLGLWDFTLFEIGILESCLKLGFSDFSQSQIEILESPLI